MARFTGPKNKIARREGVDLSLKTFGTKAHATLLKRLTITPGHKQARKFSSKLSDYGKQLREKQKIKRIYNITETKMKRYFDTAVKTKGNTAQFLVAFLESRLDNVLYRLHFAPTRNAARQLVAHGHVTVSGQKISIPSYQVKKDDIITFKTTHTAEIPYIKTILEEKNYMLPAWLKRDQLKGEVVGSVQLDEYKEPVNVALVIEFYSKL